MIEHSSQASEVAYVYIVLCEGKLELMAMADMFV